jgi:hypothetical protein
LRDAREVGQFAEREAVIAQAVDVHAEVRLHEVFQRIEEI